MLPSKDILAFFKEGTDCDEELGDEMSVEAGELEFGPASSVT